MNRQRAAWLLSFVLLAVAAFHNPLAAQRDSDYRFVRSLVDIHRQVLSNYVEKVEDGKLEKAAVDGMLAALDDPYTVYVPPAERESFDRALEGTFKGVGVQLNQLPSGEIEVLTPIDGSPAFRAGIKAGDIIVKVNGQSIQGMKIDQVIKSIAGEAGSDVALSVRHVNGQQEDLKMKRGEVVMPTVKGFQRNADESWDYYVSRNPKIAYVRVTQFTSTTFDLLKSTMDHLLKDGMEALILDLRWNPGGQLDSAVQVVDLFVDDGVIVRTKGLKRPEKIERAKHEGTLPDFPMFVLVNEHSASAAEIVAGSLMDNKRAYIVGERTYGKGSVQEVIKMDDGGELKMTVAYYYLPSGRLVHRRKGADDWGVEPQTKVPMDKDAQLKVMDDRTERERFRRPGSGPATAPTSQPLIDVQLEQALQLAKVMTVMRRQPAPAATQPVSR